MIINSSYRNKIMKSSSHTKNNDHVQHKARNSPLDKSSCKERTREGERRGTFETQDMIRDQ